MISDTVLHVHDDARCMLGFGACIALLECVWREGASLNTYTVEYGASYISAEMHFEMTLIQYLPNRRYKSGSLASLTRV